MPRAPAARPVHWRGRWRRRGAPWLLLATLWLLPGAAPAAERPLRLGLYHPHPQLCLADEPAQRDLRVLRMAFGVNLLPGHRLEWPWYIRAFAPGRAAPPGSHALALDTAGLWQRPLYRVLGTHPKLPDVGGDDRLVLWRERALAGLPGVRGAPETSLAQLLAPPAGADPFFPSRLAGSRLLPFQMGRNGRRPEELCRDWPTGVTMHAEESPLAYVLRNSRAEHGAPFVLTAYRERRELWHDYFYGRLDALLLEGADFDEELRRYRASQLGPWGVMLGTQQVVLRLHPRLAEALGRDGRMALSMALPRAQLAQVGGPGRFAAADAFLAPVLTPGAVEPAEALGWNSLRARRSWLQRPDPPGELRLAVLNHPLLLKLGERLAAHWLRTLNLTVRVQAWPFDQFPRLLADDEADLLLDVVDLDDGSLQDLWLETLRAMHAPLPGAPQRWEAALREGLAYLPLLDNIHPVLLRRNPPDGLLERVCPGCVPADSPGHLAPEPVERENPQG